jgi:hypothetical protein
VKIVVAAIVAAVAVLGVSASASARDIGANGSVAALAAVGTEVALAARVRPGCFEIRVWETADRGVRRYANHCFEETSTGSGVAAVTAADGRALWLTFTGGNIREWSLWTKSRTSRAKRIRFVARDVDAPPPVVVGSAWEGSLPYAIDRTIVVLGSNGARRFALDAPARVVFVSAHSRGYAAVLADGRVVTISSAGRVLRERAFEPGFVETAVLTARGMILKTRDGLEIRDGESRQAFELPAGSRFVGYSEGIVAYATGRELRLLRLNGARHVTFRRLAAPGFRAQLGRRGIAYSSGGKVSFVVWAFVATEVTG